MQKMTYLDFYNKVINWYNRERPASGKPRQNLISTWYDEYLKGKDFKFL